MRCLAGVAAVVGRCEPATSTVRAPASGAGSSKASLLRHAKKYGWDQVEETAKQLGIELEAPKKETDRAKAARLKKNRAWELYDDGKTPEEIAIYMSCSLSTVKKYLASP